MDGAGLARAAVVAQQTVGQGPGLAGEGGVDDEALGLVHGDEIVVLPENLQRAVLRREVRRRLLDGDAHQVAGDQGPVGVGALPVDPEDVQRLQPPHQAVGDPQLPPQGGEQLGLALHGHAQDHGLTSFVFFYYSPAKGEKQEGDLRRRACKAGETGLQ